MIAGIILGFGACVVMLLASAMTEPPAPWEVEETTEHYENEGEGK